MIIRGTWLLGNDGVTRPVLLARVVRAEGMTLYEPFLIDTGSDRTVFGAGLLDQLDLPTSDPAPDLHLMSIGGASRFVLVRTALALDRADGATARIWGEFAVLTDPAASDLSILGRDVLNQFDVILSRPRDEVTLLAGNHRYKITSRA